MMRVQTRAGERTFISLTELRQILDLNDEAFRQAVKLLCEAEPPFLTYLRRESSPSRGYCMPSGWEPIHAPHLRRYAIELLREAGIPTGGAADGLGKLGRVWAA